MAHEEAVLEAVVEWIKAGREEEGRRERLLGLIRYGLLTALLLKEVGLRAKEMVGEGLGVRLRALTKAALALLWMGGALQQLLAAVQEG